MTSDLRTQLQAALGAAYTVERELGGGGMSRVFVATETTLGRKVVVKVLPPELAAELSVERFRREIQVAAQLQHPHIVPLLAAGEADGLLYFTMPYVDGESLRTRLARDGELPVAVAIRILGDVAKALAYAHRRGVVHRDIKPENVLLAEGEALVTDFGVAKALSASTAEGGGGLTSVGLALGTPAYMAPEQAVGDAGVDARADLYALGAVAYELLTGQGMFPGRSPQALLAAHSTETPEAIERRRPNVPRPLASLVMRSLAKRPADRPQSADQVLRELEALGPGDSGAPAAGARESLAAAWSSWRVAGLGTVAVVLVAFGAWRIVTRARAAPPSPPVAGTPVQQSIAVLPFVNMSGEKENEYFSEGITEELIDRLANLRGLRVAARTSAFAFKGKDEDVREIGRQLNVHNVVEGSVRRAGSRIRVTAQLIDADSGYHRWSHTYEGDLKDVFALQDQIGTSIAAALKLALGAGDSAALARAPTRDTLAHTLYLQGRYLWSKRTGESLQRAIALFQQAIARDSTYAEAWGGLAESYAVLPGYLNVSYDSTLPKLMAAADRALTLDSTLASARAPRGLGFWWIRRWSRSEQELRTVIARHPNYATAHHWLGNLLFAEGREQEGLAESSRAADLDPLSLVISTDRGRLLFMARRYDDAEAQLRATVDRDPAYPYALSALGMVMLQQHRPDSGLALIRRGQAIEGEHASTTYLARIGYTLAVTGHADSARAILRALEARSAHEYVAANAIGFVQLGLGERDAAFVSFARALDAHEQSFFISANFPAGPAFDPIRADQRFKGLLTRAGLR